MRGTTRAVIGSLPRSFYARDAETVARALLGCELVHRVCGVERRVRIVETEAYVGEHDLACHASKGRTKRTEVMFGAPGRAYVYFVYGMHHMLNVVTGREGVAEAVLIRAAEPLAGVDGSMAGPARLTRAIGVTTREHDAMDLCGATLFLRPGAAPARVVTTARIGVDYAQAWKDAPLRFYDADSRHVSRK